MSDTVESPTGNAPEAGSLSLWGRTVRVFASPATAWVGLEARALWWFPLLLTLAFQAVLMIATFHRALVPMMLERWDEAVANGQMQPEQVEKISGFFQNSPFAMPIVVVQQVIVVAILTFVVAITLWFGIGFVLGARFRYRLALEVVCWASLVRIPETILTGVVAWSKQSLEGIHFGLAALLPESSPPTRLHAGLAVLLDAIGPFGIWYLVVTIVGGAALSGAPRRNVAWVFVALYLALGAIFAVVAAFTTPAA